MSQGNAVHSKVLILCILCNFRNEGSLSVVGTLDDKPLIRPCMCKQKIQAVKGCSTPSKSITVSQSLICTEYVPVGQNHGAMTLILFIRRN